MLDLPTTIGMVANLAVIVAVAVGLVEVRHALRARRDTAAVELVHAIQNQEIRRALDRIQSLPNDADPDLINGDPELFQAALAVDSACEMWGSIVYEGVIDLHMFDRMVGGVVRASWLRLRRWAEDTRIRNNNPNMAEWWEWLYERLEADPAPGKTAGAHVLYRDRSRR